MSHTYINCLVHCVFSTKGRVNSISPEVQERLYPYISGIVKNHNIKALATGGTEDHIHILLSLPSTITLAKALQAIKGISSKWIHETFPGKRDFAWQSGYAAFSVSISHIEKTIKYIHGQKEHHRKRTFQEELISFLEAHGIEYDKRYFPG